MCNLYDIGPARHRNREDWEEAVMEAIRQLEKPFGIRKTDPALAMTGIDPANSLVTLRWGFERSYNPAVNNARSEKLDGVWSELWTQKRRCLLPVSTFYEWSGGTGHKQTHAFQSPDPDQLLWIAGLWEEVEGREASCSMLTREASGPIAEIHHRMPVILQREDHEAFFNEPDPRALIQTAQDDLTMFRCHNPLKSPASHRGPEKEASDFLPGFE